MPVFRHRNYLCHKFTKKIYNNVPVIIEDDDDIDVMDVDAIHSKTVLADIMKKEIIVSQRH